MKKHKILPTAKHSAHPPSTPAKFNEVKLFKFTNEKQGKKKFIFIIFDDWVPSWYFGLL